MDIAKQDLINRIMRPSKAPEVVVANSTPVVSFGDCTKATVATLGINPSVGEFETKGVLLSGNKARLRYLNPNEHLTDESVANEVLEASNRYFSVNPYWRWFGQLERNALNPQGYSYLDGSAVHLDLVQSATDPLWRDLTKDEKRVLIEEDLPFLELQLKSGQYRTVFMNGRQVLSTVSDLNLVDLEHAHRFIMTQGTPCDIYMGSRNDGTTFVGWSMNIQNYCSASDKQELQQWLQSIS